MLTRPAQPLQTGNDVQVNSPPPSTASAVDLFCSLPQNALETIQEQAGPPMRQVCRTLRALHPPRRSCALQGPTDPTHLQASLATLPPALTSLDLRRCTDPPWVTAKHNYSSHPITPAALATISTTLPNLQQLHLPTLPSTLLPAILNTVQACPHLHTLHIAPFARVVLRGRRTQPPTPSWAPLLHPPTATRLRSLTLPSDALPTFHLAPPGTFPSLLTACFDGTVHTLSVDSSHLLNLPAIAPALRCLRIRGHLFCGDPGQFAALATLTSLTISTSITAHSELLPRIGTLTALRSLSICLHHANETSLGNASWLPCLTQLTHLQIIFSFDTGYLQGSDLDFESEDEAPMTSPIMEAAAQLPLLHSLQFDFDYESNAAAYNEWLASGQPSSFFSHLAAATQLRRLCLTSIPLVEESALLSSLQALTSLQLHSCRPMSPTGEHNPLRPLHWLPDLTNLQHFSWCDGRRSKVPPGEELPDWQQALAALPHLHTLALMTLAHVTEASHPIADLLGAVGGRLERLQVGGVWLGGTEDEPGGSQDDRVWARVASMERLTVLDLSDVSDSEAVAPRLQLPAGVRRCYVDAGLDGSEALESMRARHPWVAFRTHGRLECDMW